MTLKDCQGSHTQKICRQTRFGQIDQEKKAKHSSTNRKGASAINEKGETILCSAKTTTTQAMSVKKEEEEEENKKRKFT